MYKPKEAACFRQPLLVYIKLFNLITGYDRMSLQLGIA